MEFVIEQKVMADGLAAVRAVVDKRNTIPILSNVLIRADGAGLHLVATDLDIEVSVSLPAQIVSMGASTAPGHLLHDMIKRLPKGAQVSVKTDPKEGGRIAVSAGKARYDVLTLPKEDFPEMQRGDGGTQFSMGAPELRQMIDRVEMSMSTEETRFYLNGFFLHVAAGGMCGVSTDGHRLTRYVSPLPIGADGLTGVIVPSKTAAQLKGLLAGVEGDVALSVSATRIVAEFGNVVLVSKLIDGTFPDYQRVIPSGNANALTISIEHFGHVVDRAAVVLVGSAAIKLELAPTACSISASNPDSGTSDETMDAEYAGVPLEIGFNNRYLRDMLAQMTGPEVRVALGDAGAPAVLTDPLDDSTLYVLMPMRV